MTTTNRSAPVPGDGLLHPVAIGAITLLLINDHLLKAAAPGLVTGKLSDVAGLVFFPLMLVAGWEVMSAATDRWTLDIDRSINLSAQYPAVSAGSTLPPGEALGVTVSP